LYENGRHLADVHCELPEPGHIVESTISRLTRQVLPLTVQVTVHINDPRHEAKSVRTNIDEWTVRLVVLSDHLYSHVFSIDSLASIEQVVFFGGQTSCVIGIAWVLLYANPDARNTVLKLNTLIHARISRYLLWLADVILKKVATLNFSK